MKRFISFFILILMLTLCINPIALAVPNAYSATNKINNSGNEPFSWFIGISIGIIVFCIVSAIISLCKRIENDRSNESNDYIGRSNENYVRITSNTSGSSIYYPAGVLEGAKINGHSILTIEDKDRWYVNKGFSQAIHAHLGELENTIENDTHENANIAFNDWFVYYEKYRNLCLKHGMWNDCINDHAPFNASQYQISMEDRLKESIKKKYEAAEKSRVEDKPYYDAILDYLKRQPKHSAQRSTMFREISSKMNTSIESIRKVYRKMVKASILSESIIDHHYFVRKAAVKRKPKLKPSVYKPERYEKVDKYTMYKIEYTVGCPQNIDRTANTCEFISLSTGQKYYTSLERCTCPAYSGQRNPCKHMVALAIQLGYYR